MTKNIWHKAQIPRISGKNSISECWFLYICGSPSVIWENIIRERNAESTNEKLDGLKRKTNPECKQGSWNLKWTTAGDWLEVIFFRCLFHNMVETSLACKKSSPRVGSSWTNGSWIQPSEPPSTFRKIPLSFCLFLCCLKIMAYSIAVGGSLHQAKKTQKPSQGGYLVLAHTERIL